MNKMGQVLLVSISLLFNTYQTINGSDQFFTLDFFVFTIIAWFVGLQFDKVRFYEKKALNSKESYKQLIDSLPECIIIHRDNKIIYVNKAVVSMFDASNKEEIIGRSIQDFIVPEYQDRLTERIHLIKEERKPLSSIVYKLKRFNNQTFYFEVSSLLIVFGEEEAILTMGKDITERKKQTEQLLQKSEKLALLGQMAAGIAHEIRNPLTSIKGFIQLFKSKYDEKHFDLVLSELERINSIVNEFMVLAKPTAVVYIKQDVKILLQEVITLINTQSILNNVQITVKYDDHLPMINCEPNQLKQVFLNILKNAIESMPKGGTIHVEVKQKDIGKISIQVIDQGVGIPQDRISTLGEPFYTTKEKGTGLGLMICYKIIESHNGTLSITSKVNMGTTVDIILPTLTQPTLKVSSS